jgi:polysaccharide deacetylase 2 family uncharacterized protein YibQ
MAANDLNQPLRRKGRPAPAQGRRSFVPAALVSAAVILAMVAAVWVAIVDDPDGGRPVVVAAIEDVPDSTGSLAASGAANGPAAQVPEVRLDMAALPAPPPATGSQSALHEQTAFGPLPRISPDGRRPREAYARRAASAATGVPRIAIVVGGMGLSQTGTQKAIEALPEDVTLAFAPYGSSLQRWVQKAREEGHEVLLQIPLEPLGYPEENPGEHTLLVAADRHSNRENLNWVLGRMTAYAGVMNYMGARFTGEDGVLVPFLGEIGERGLYYLDDGSSPRSRAGTVGAALQVPVVTADAILDRNRAPQAIESELRNLEATARSRGVAVGVASAFPASVETIVGWARDAQTRGIVLVPASAAIEPRR